MCAIICIISILPSSLLEFQCGIPPAPTEIEDEENGGTYYLVPHNIRPTMAPHRIEVLFWGVRELKKINFQSVEKPWVIIDCVGESVECLPLESAKNNPNYPEPWACFDLDLPEEDRYELNNNLHIFL